MNELLGWIASCVPWALVAWAFSYGATPGILALALMLYWCFNEGRPK